MKNLSIILYAITISACTAKLNYLGDIYEPTTQIDVYYDEGDIYQKFKVIGQLTGDNSTNSFVNLDKIKQDMIHDAKKKGAEGIWFLFSDSYDEAHIVKAKLIKYID